MTIHLPSFILGVLALPAAASVVWLVFRFATGFKDGGSLSGVGSGPGAQSGFDQLRFTPRLIGQLRRPLDTDEDHAKAS